MVMPDDTNPFTSADVLVDARKRISIGPVPAWVVSCPFDADFKAKGSKSGHHLFVSRQIHAENVRLIITWRCGWNHAGGATPISMAASI